MTRELGYPLDSGLLVADRLPDTPPEIKRGDLLLKLGSSVIRNSSDLAAELKSLHYHDTVPAVFLTTVSYQGKSYPARRNVILSVR